MIDSQVILQHRLYVVRPTLEALNLWSPSAENLVLGTEIQESDLRFIDQVDQANKPGPAYGFCQMERMTFDDIWTNFLAARLPLRQSILMLCLNGVRPPVTELRGNAFLAVAMCRLVYLRVPQRLPAAKDSQSLAEFWKQHYNTPLGKGTVLQALPKFDFVCRYDQ